MMTRNSSDVSSLLQRSVGTRCWHVSVGGASLPTFSLALGGKIPRESELPNKAQPRAFRRYYPEVQFYVWCTWRLEDRSGVIATSRFPPARVVGSLNRCLGRRIIEAYVVPPAWDLVLIFERQLVLRMFCDRAPARAAEDWDARVGDRSIWVGPRGRVSVGMGPLDSSGGSVPRGRTGTSRT